MRLANASLLVVLGRANSAAIGAPCVLEELGSRTPDDVDLVLGQPPGAPHGAAAGATDPRHRVGPGSSERRPLRAPGARRDRLPRAVGAGARVLRAPGAAGGPARAARA